MAIAFAIAYIKTRTILQTCLPDLEAVTAGVLPAADLLRT
jgi:hypothetical protein